MLNLKAALFFILTIVLVASSTSSASKECSRVFVFQKEERVYHWMKPIKEVFTSATTAEQAAQLTRKNNLRLNFFQILAAARILDETDFSEKHDTKSLIKVRKKIKALEDSFDDYLLSRDISQFAEEKKFPPDFVDWLKRQKWDAFRKYEAFLTNNKWYGEDAAAFKKIEELIEKTNWPKYSKTEKHILKALIQAIENVEKYVEPTVSQHIKEKKFAFEDLEEGLHEWRRQLRRVLLFVTAFDDLFKLDMGTNKPWEAALVKHYHGNTKYVLATQGPGKIEVPVGPFYDLLDTMLTAGDIKDVVEQKHYLAKALVEYKTFNGQKVYNHDQAVMLIENHLGPSSVEKDAQVLWTRYQKRESLDVMRKSLKKQLNTLKDD